MGRRRGPEQLALDLEWFHLEDFLAAIGLHPVPGQAGYYWDRECICLRLEGDGLVMEEYGYSPELAVMDALARGGEMFIEPGYSDPSDYHYGLRLRAPYPHTFDEAFDTFLRFGRVEADEREEVRKDYEYAGFRRVFGGFLFGP
jgi:hypothetical protein